MAEIASILSTAGNKKGEEWPIGLPNRHRNCMYEKRSDLDVGFYL